MMEVVKHKTKQKQPNKQMKNKNNIDKITVLTEEDCLLKQPNFVAHHLGNLLRKKK